MSSTIAVGAGLQSRVEACYDDGLQARAVGELVIEEIV
jgi:hypothetical protein